MGRMEIALTGSNAEPLKFGCFKPKDIQLTSAEERRSPSWAAAAWLVVLSETLTWGLEGFAARACLAAMQSPGALSSSVGLQRCALGVGRVLQPHPGRFCLSAVCMSKEGTETTPHA